jgi:hypothetical protein
MNPWFSKPTLPPLQMLAKCWLYSAMDPMKHVQPASGISQLHHPGTYQTTPDNGYFAQHGDKHRHILHSFPDQK